jgi:hypothetical protein
MARVAGDWGDSDGCRRAAAAVAAAAKAPIQAMLVLVVEL